MTTTRIRASRARLSMILAVLAVLAAAMVGSPSTAQEDPPPISAVPLSGRHQFTDDIDLQVRLKPEGRPRNVVKVGDPSLMTVLEITVQPGARFPWHTHPGAVLATVTEGELVYVYGDDCVERPYPAGTAFVDPGGSIHTAFNPTDDETVVVAVFFDAPPAGPVTIPVDAGTAEQFDAKCGMAATAHAH